MPPHDLVHAPDGRTWYETAIVEAEKRGKLQEALEEILSNAWEDEREPTYSVPQSAIEKARLALAN